MTETIAVTGLDEVEEGKQYAVVVSHLTKEFRVRYRTSVKRRLISLFDGSEPTLKRFTALSDVSFCVPHGQTVAIIGRNGSGKSTLMGLLARVYRKTSGEIRLYGADGGAARIAPLLELGAGFHIDLTGEENIEFYGAILGMSAREMRQKFDRIVEFAELGDKVRTAVRNWNDGARLRLGFAIAIHTDPDILLIDEVLAVGDEAFQTKCYRKVEELQRQGKTILFVSHDLAKVERVAQRVIWLMDGQIHMDGEVKTVLEAYRLYSATQAGS
ncbi:MAG TPA: ABC transporter ATP-binding protein [Chthonomonas sp.]|uniref:ABC transporter ATP-binding protein n=1 Tax=Chthonomonas sp. TaxID=2282153 RepID=UPI002B4AB8E2|nr:ABC transporter ATP-binding protein [Chthonomonas sp.]HLI49897.1 ABC transporter ATP-binding protein [Chthonomonas sp.]